MNKKLLWIPLGLIAVCVLIYTCRGTENKFGDVFKGKVPAVASAKETVNKVNLFLDVSGSMKGFVDFTNIDRTVPPTNEMPNVLSVLLNRIEENFKKVKISCYGGDKQYSKEGFIDGLRNKTVFNAPSTELVDMFNVAIDSARNDRLSIIVSDMVLSYGKKRLIAENNPHFNLDQLKGLQASLVTEFQKAKAKKCEIVILQYLNSFNGSYYYNYTENLEGKKFYGNKHMQKRPFYVVLIGSRSLIESILANNLSIVR